MYECSGATIFGRASAWPLSKIELELITETMALSEQKYCSDSKLFHPKHRCKKAARRVQLHMLWPSRESPAVVRPVHIRPTRSSLQLRFAPITFSTTRSLLRSLYYYKLLEF
jgi:hypothetical protein